MLRVCCLTIFTLSIPVGGYLRPNNAHFLLSLNETSIPSSEPVSMPSSFPSTQPTVFPSVQPSTKPSRFPTRQPSAQPSNSPTSQPSAHPVAKPSSQPTTHPTAMPTKPSSQPTAQPSKRPSSQPTSNPTQPTSQPTSIPSSQPTLRPSSRPTTQPSASPSRQPTAQPTASPTEAPSAQPSAQPTNPTGQPTSHPTNPTGQPTAVPSGQPTLVPTSNPTKKVPVVYDWVFDPKYGLALSLDVSLAINGACILFSLWCMYSYGIQASLETRKAAGLFASALITLLTFIFLAAKTNYFFSSGNSYDLLKTQAGEYVWAGKNYYSANVPTLKAAQCPYSVNPDGTVAELEHVTEKLCQFIALSFSGNLVSDGMTKFSIILGLMFYFVLMWMAFGVKMVMSDRLREGVRAREDITWSEWFMMMSTSHGAQFIICLVIQSQQFCVLMLLTNVTANDYCARLDVPTTDKQGICYYEYGVHALPWGIIFSLATVASAYLAAAFARGGEGEGNWLSLILALLAAACAAFCGIHAVGFLAYWVFAGFGIGVWFEFASMEVTTRFVVVEFLSLSAFVMNDVLEFFSVILSHFGCGMSAFRFVVDQAANANAQAAQVENDGIEMTSDKMAEEAAEEDRDVFSRRGRSARSSSSQGSPASTAYSPAPNTI